MPRRLALFALLLLFTPALVRCGEARPCASCPPLAGHWELLFDEQSRSADCAVVPMGAPPALLDLTQVGSTARAEIGSLELVGTVYDSWDFTLAGAAQADGSAATDSISARGHYSPPAADGGATIRGTWSASARRQSADLPRTCSVDLAFTGTRR